MPQNRRARSPFHTNLFKWVIAGWRMVILIQFKCIFFAQIAVSWFFWRQTLKGRPTNSSARSNLSVFLLCLIWTYMQRKPTIFIGYSARRRQDSFNLTVLADVASICCGLKTNVLVFFPLCMWLSQDYNDEIRQEQLRELSLLNGSDESSRGRSAQGRSARPATTVSIR